jgi:hypothetical protein
VGRLLGRAQLRRRQCRVHAAAVERQAARGGPAELNEQADRIYIEDRYSRAELADLYGLTDTDGSRPDCWGLVEKYGIDHHGTEGIAGFR